MPVGKLSVSAALLFAALICSVGAVPQTASAQQTQKPNILVIFGDDVGQTNISAYSFGLMGYSTPNIDRLANEGMKFTDYYGENSCTAGRSAFITGQTPKRTGLFRVGIPGVAVGIQDRDVTIAQALKPLGYATGQFGKNHLGDRDEYLPTNHGFDEFFGNYEFKGGFPTPEASRKSLDDTDFMRAVTAYRFFYPTVSMEGTIQGQRDAGAVDNKSALVLAGGPRHVLFTGNSDTPYMGTVVNLKEAGPVVVELPPGPYLGIVNDHNYGYIADMGLPGPDAGKGGKHLILPPDYKGEAPEGYYTSRSRTNLVLVAARALPPGGDLNAALEAQKKIKIYPLSEASTPAPFEFLDRTNDKIDVTLLRWEDNFQFWEQLNKAVQEETVIEEFRPMYGMLAMLGIEKGNPFSPDARMKASSNAQPKRVATRCLLRASPATGLTALSGRTGSGNTPLWSGRMAISNCRLA